MAKLDALDIVAISSVFAFIVVFIDSIADIVIALLKGRGK